MKQSSRFARPGAAIVAFFMATGSAVASESNGTPAARALAAQAETLARSGKAAEAAALFQKAIEADPDYVDAHQRYIETTQRVENPGSRTPSLPRLKEQYARWAREQPTRAVYQLALGLLASEANTADEYFNAALKIAPSFARAHFLLAKNADQRGDWEGQRQHLEAAVDGNPAEPRYLVKYAQAFKRTDPARFRELALSVVDKFPSTPSAAEALYDVANAASNPERRMLFERLHAVYPPDKFPYSATAMYDFYEDVTTPAEALAIAQEMAKVYPTSKTWERRIALQRAMGQAAALVAERRFGDALEVLARTERPSGTHGATWALLKADAAAGAGRIEEAYASLVESVAAVPDERIEAALRNDGAALHKTAADVTADIWRIRDAKAKPATAFELEADRGKTPVSLADYRGRVVLLAFWFPG